LIKDKSSSIITENFNSQTKYLMVKSTYYLIILQDENLKGLVEGGRKL